jgi:release factor glutamine methyltransferase
VSDSWTTLKVLEWTTQRFDRAEIESARLEAQVLLASVLGCDRVALYTRFDQPLGADELAAYRELIRRRLAGEPVAYLVGEQEFWSLPFEVAPSVLIPRRDSETVIEVVLDRIADRKAALRIADIGTGSGALAITLAHELPAATVIATDLSADALAVAERNAARNSVADRVELRRGDLLAPLAGEPGFDVVVANLPYVRTGELAGLAREVGREPVGALDGGPDGLAPMRALVAGVADRLVPGGLLVLEHGFDQAADVAAMIRDTGRFDEIETRKDLGKQPRVTSARAVSSPPV